MSSLEEKKKIDKALEPLARMCLEVACCWPCSVCFEDQPKRRACSASLSAIFYGGLLIGYATAGKSTLPACLIFGITGVALGTVTSGGLCAHEFLCKSDSAPVEHQPGVVRPAIISQPR